MKSSLPSIKRVSETIGNINPTFIGVKTAKFNLIGSELDLSLANYFSKTVSANTTFSVIKQPPKDNLIIFYLNLTNGGAFTLTWWSNLKWQSATAPTLTAAGRDLLAFYTEDGGATWTGLILGRDLR